MSLAISNSLPLSYNSTVSAAGIEESQSASSSSTSAAAKAPDNKYLGGYISSATAALSLLTQSEAGFSQRSETRTSDANGTTVDTSGADFFEEAAGLGNNVFAQAFKSSTHFSNTGGAKTATGEYQSAAASEVGGSSSGVEVSASLSTSSYDFKPGGAFDLKGEVFNLTITLNGNTKDTAHLSFLVPDGKVVDKTTGEIENKATGEVIDACKDPNGSFDGGVTYKNFVEAAIAGSLVYDGLSGQAALEETEQLTDFTLGGIEGATGQATTSSGAQASAAGQATSSSISSTKAAPDSYDSNNLRQYIDQLVHTPLFLAGTPTEAE